ncbi:PRELI domain-containing protein 2-like [Limulus polyphemus]|uniref:PRELI domain-containing protein 2-like n=1 Tax=Limulus polyphemus TaxID=6850 RepID=A0ABM1T0N4_LIMPO|nr:PRELI domain-containing protein 2-like [Limulus polyphemus]
MVITLKIIHIFKYPIELVAETHLNKYPNDKEKNVLAVETVEKTQNKDGTLYIKRIAYCNNIVPFVLRQLSDLNKSVVHVEEQCWLNYLRRSLLIQSRNLTWTNYARLSEESYFQPVRENPQWTYFEQSGTVDIHGLGYLGCIIENFARKFLQKGIKKSLWIMEELLAEKASEFRYASAEE